MGFLGDLRRIHTAAERYRGYAEALRERGIVAEERLIRRDIQTERLAEEATRELLRSPPAPTERRSSRPSRPDAVASDPRSQRGP